MRLLDALQSPEWLPRPTKVGWWWQARLTETGWVISRPVLIEPITILKQWHSYPDVLWTPALIPTLPINPQENDVS